MKALGVEYALAFGFASAEESAKETVHVDEDHISNFPKGSKPLHQLTTWASSRRAECIDTRCLSLIGSCFTDQSIKNRMSIVDGSV